MPAGKRTLRLILCGVCFKESCQFSRWVEDDEPDGEYLSLLDEIQQLWLMQQHEQLDLMEASKQEIESVIDDIQSMADSTGDTIQIQTQINGELFTKEYKPSSSTITTDKGSFIDDILRNASEQIERTGDADKTMEH